MAKSIDLSGQCFGRLTVVEPAGRTRGYVAWKCHCECGGERVVDGQSLRCGATRSCGCIKKERMAELGRSQRDDLTGQRFGRLVVVRLAGDMQSRWQCRCDCGRSTVVRAHNLKQETVRSCGCLAAETVVANGRKAGGRNRKEMTGRRFGRLVVIERAENIGTCAAWRCRCDCGQECAVHGAKLRNGQTRSCGCLFAETLSANATTHGGFRNGARPREYGRWYHILQRCTNPNNRAFLDYGGRGIRMCIRWQLDPVAFASDMGPYPDDGRRYTVDRLDNSRGYECGKSECSDCGPLGRAPNCRWATDAEQSRNKTTTRFVEAFGQRMCIADWSLRTGLKASTIAGRMERDWPTERALSEGAPYPPTPSSVAQQT